MCGIAGTYGEPSLDVEEALDRIAHRGPDGRGIEEHARAVHGHVRLAIQDPTPRSAQPFRLAGVTLSCVGEIWNAAELRVRLEEECDYRFMTTGDTEVVAAAIYRWGERALERLDGMFALAWTDPSGTYLARDRFGKVPLYWLPPEDGLFGTGSAWASERKGLLARAADGEAVPPGAILRLSEGGRLAWFASPDRGAEPRETSAEDVRGMLKRGVAKRLVSDVPLCCLISGGMDSAAILGLVRESRPVVAFHAYRDPGSPDLAAARRLCEEWDVELREVLVSDPDAGAVAEAVRAVEVPMKAQVEIALLCLPLARRLREDGFRVVLSGEAADEVFGGYGNLARKSGTDASWRAARAAAVAKMARGNFVRVNKVFMAHGVEGRLPFMERELVERVLALGVRECPPGKRLLKDALAGLVPDWVLARQKETFQGAGGMISACANLYESPTLAYNDVARRLFGALPRE